MRSRLPFVGSRLSLHDPVALRVVLLRIAFCAAVSTLLIVGGRAFAQRAGALIGFVLSTPPAPWLRRRERGRLHAS